MKAARPTTARPSLTAAQWKCSYVTHFVDFRQLEKQTQSIALRRLRKRKCARIHRNQLEHPEHRIFAIRRFFETYPFACLEQKTYTPR